MRYKTIDDHPEMGLNNNLCKNPIAYCCSKRVYLSKDDIRVKHCKNKLTVDMIGYHKCNCLKRLDN